MRNHAGLPIAAALVLALGVACGPPPAPAILSVSPKTLCANIESKLTITGTNLDALKVEIGRDVDMSAVTSVAATTVTGDNMTVTATFAAATLTPDAMTYDVILTTRGGQRVVAKDAVTVVPGISLAAVDPAAVWSGADFPTSVFGTGMAGVVKITVTSAAGATPTALTGVTAVDANRVDAVVPKGLAAGMYDVTATDKDGCSATLAKALTVVADLTISVCAIDPIFGFDKIDSPVTITATADGKTTGAPCGGKTGLFASTPRAWLAVGGSLKALRNVAYTSTDPVSGATLTATVPSGLTVGGPYDLIVQNPDGSVGLLTMAFKVVDKPVPAVTSLDPPVIPSNFNGLYKIFGKNFRDPVKVEVYGPTGALINVPAPVVKSDTEIDIVAFDPGSLALPVGAFVVRVTNTDQGTFGEYTAMAIISASFNIGSWTDVKATPMPVALMRHGAAAGQVSLAARYLYVVGGDTGGNAPVLQDSTQIATLDKFGNVGGWFAGRYKLPAARTALQLTSVPHASGEGGLLYAVGGSTSAGAVTTVSRARILLPQEAPKITKSQVSLGGKLARGTWYYKVSAVLDGTDVANPLGETLASEEFAAHTVPEAKVTLEWMAVPKAATYRVYRTEKINGVSGTEILLKEGVADVKFVDDGTLTPQTGTPLRQGEHGVWVAVPSLMVARRGLGLAMAHDPSGNPYLYAVGGDKGTGATVMTADVLDTYEHSRISDDGLTLAAWTVGTSKLASPRTRLQSPVGEHSTSPNVAVNAAFVYAIGGFDGTAVVGSYQIATVQSDGTLTWGVTQASNGILQALQSIVASNQMFALGGADAAGAPQKIVKSDVYMTPPSFGGLNTNSAAATDVSTLQSIASYAGLAFSSAHLYLLGGTTDGTTAINRLWSNVY